MKSGIYYIKNKVNNKIYVGSSNNVLYRKIHHFSELRRQIHKNDYFQKSFNKYGEENFVFHIIEYLEIKNLLNREQYWIDYYKASERKYGYNICRIAGRADTWINKKHHTEETRKKLSIANIGQKRSLESRLNMSNAQKKLYKNGYENPCSKPVMRISKKSGEITKFKSGRDAYRKTGVHYASISNYCLGLQQSYSSYTWKFI